MTSSLDSSIKSAVSDLTLSAELSVPMPAPSESRSSFLNSSNPPVITLGPVSIPLGTSTGPHPISGVFTKDSMEIGNSLSLDTTTDQMP